ncbi:MAG: hypothetical protein IJS00_04050 [Paludibacteraceae bacterium]|nr:hypothetical protein [Paludibacteraceae bacterium]
MAIVFPSYIREVFAKFTLVLVNIELPVVNVLFMEILVFVEPSLPDIVKVEPLFVNLPLSKVWLCSERLPMVK